MSDASQSALRYAVEVVAGTTPANPVFQEVAFVSSALSFNPDTEADDSIISDRQVLDLSLLGYDVDGENEHRLRYGALDELMELAFFSTWNKRPNLAVTAYNTGTGAYTVASGGAAFLAGHLVVGKNFALAVNNNVAKKVTASTATTVTTSAGGATDTTGLVQVVGIEGAAADIAAVADGITTTALNFINLGFVVGMWVKIGGTAVGTQFAITANNDWARISAVSATKLTFDSFPTGWTADTGTGKTIRVWMGDYLRNGTTKKSVTFEREYKRSDDNSPMYRYFRGCYLGMNIDLSARAMISVTFNVLGISASPISGTRFAGASTLPAIFGEVMNASSNLGTFRLNGVPLANPNFILGASVDINNNLRGREAVSTPAFIGVAAGSFELTGNVESYLGDASMLNALQNNTATALAFPILSTDRLSGYHIDIPRVKFADGSEDIGGNDEDIAPDLGYQGLKHPTLLYTGQISRFPYLEF